MDTERYQSVDMDEIYYITDTQKLNKTYEDFLKDYEGEEFQEEHAKDDWREYLLENSMDGTEVVEALNRQDRVIDAQAEINEKREKEYQELYNECQRHKRLRFKNAREIQARVNAFNRIVDSLKGQVPDWIIKELETAQILECDYEED
ncbi:hypothetical protein [Methanobrevibacter sp.]|uniref:hypothetical protein n=1 Tax=Methanobrevibacter sp. TaxID=66852 RepID=UPI003863353C